MRTGGRSNCLHSFSRRPPLEAANSSSIKGMASRTVAYATAIGVGCTWSETRRASALLGDGKVNEDGRDEAIKYEALTRFVLKGYMKVPC